MSIDLQKDVSKFPAKEKNGNSVITKEKLKDAKLYCEWNMCCVILTKKEMVKFLMHISDHISATKGPPTSEGYVCLWRNCGFACPSLAERVRHIYFHAFHSKIKGIGEVVMKLQNLQCTIDDQTKNIIPEIPEPFECLWGNCCTTFVSAQDFYWHAEAHPSSVYPKNSPGNGRFICSWRGCKTTTKVSYRLIDHVRSHTQEKLVACPNCGSIFASFPRFRDHCFRHVAEEYQKFECSHCKCKFATERLLREHIRSHVNHFKCPHCEMTCPTKFAMESHVIYRHTNNKPFKCSECDKRFKFQQDVLKHLPSHSAVASFVCPFPDCQYSSRSYSSYRIHMKKKHTEAETHIYPYMCHICEKKFSLGAQLTKHLKTVHDFHWPSGHIRFRYSKDDDGFYKLQTTRIESIELAQEILNEEAETNPDDPDTQEPSSPEISEKQICGKDGFTYKSKKVHKEVKSLYYICHICQEKFLKGPKLTDHLERIHEYLWSSVSTIFRYRKVKDDYRLSRITFKSFTFDQEMEKGTFSVAGILAEDAEDNLDDEESSQLFKCQICQWKCEEKQALLLHFERNHNFKWPAENFQCRYNREEGGCKVLSSLLFANFKSANEMLTTNKKSEIMAQNPEESDTVLHVKKHSNIAENHFVCPICKSEFNREQKLKLHLKSHKHLLSPASNGQISKDNQVDLEPGTSQTVLNQPVPKVKEPEKHSSSPQAKQPRENSHNSSPWLSLTSDVIMTVSDAHSNSSASKNSEALKALFMCHLCEKRFPKSSGLTSHLKQDHSFFSLSKNTKYRYFKDVDGYFKLVLSQRKSIEGNSEILDNIDQTGNSATSLPMTPDVLSTSYTPCRESIVMKQREALENMYRCHICQKRFSNGSKLTDHLQVIHKYALSKSPIKFCKKDDGCWELRTIRSDGLESQVGFYDYTGNNFDNTTELPMTPDVTFCIPGITGVITDVQEQYKVPKKQFQCHICENKFEDGLRLTCHLKNTHAFHWSDSTRVRYSKDIDGYFKLQFEEECYSDDHKNQLPKTPEATYTIPGFTAETEELMSRPFKKRRTEENQVLRFVDL